MSAIKKNPVKNGGITIKNRILCLHAQTLSRPRSVHSLKTFCANDARIASANFQKHS